MGIELVLGALSIAVGVIGGIAQASSTAAAASEQREARNISGAQDKIRSMEDRRARIREDRIRRAQLLAASENTGTTGSSGQIGAIGALSTNLAGLVGSSLGESRANEAINGAVQRSADHQSTANQIGAWTNTIQGAIGGFSSVFDKKG